MKDQLVMEIIRATPQIESASLIFRCSLITNEEAHKIYIARKSDMISLENQSVLELLESKSEEHLKKMEEKNSQITLRRLTEATEMQNRLLKSIQEKVEINTKALEENANMMQAAIKKIENMSKQFHGMDQKLEHVTNFSKFKTTKFTMNDNVALPDGSKIYLQEVIAVDGPRQIIVGRSVNSLSP